MSHYIERLCPKHGEYMEDVDNIAGCTECPDPRQALNDARPVMEKLSKETCGFCEQRPGYKECRHGQARAWMKKYFSEEEEDG